MELLQCLSCYEEFEKRDNFPDLLVCAECVPEPLKMDDTRCPKCGWDSISDDMGDNIQEIKNKRYNMYIAIQYGSYHPYDWTEVWKCPECSKVFEYDNGSE